jgi:hypothetical protein
VADTLGTVEAFEGQDMQVRYEEAGEDGLRVVAVPGEHPLELAQRLQRKHYRFKPGKISYERCRECDVPLAISRYRWDLEEGMITAEDTGRRVAILGPLALEAVLDDLEAAHGRSIVEAAIEAERRYVHEMVDAEELRGLVYSLQALTSLRGLGNVTRFKADDERVDITIENSCMHLILVGMAQALYELALGRENSTRQWELREDGDLYLIISP